MVDKFKDVVGFLARTAETRGGTTGLLLIGVLVGAGLWKIGFPRGENLAEACFTAFIALTRADYSAKETQ